MCAFPSADCNGYAVRCGDDVVLIDSGAGSATQALLAELECDGIPRGSLTTLLLTHGHLDHSGGAAFLSRELGLRVLCSAETAAALSAGDEEYISLAAAKRAGLYSADARLQPCRVDEVLHDGQIWTIGDVTIQAVQTPGHSDDHFAYLVQTPTELLAFVGDAVFHGGRVILQDTWDCRPAAYAASLRLLAAMPIDGLFPGHGVWSLARGADQVRLALPSLERLLLPPNAL